MDGFARAIKWPIDKVAWIIFHNLVEQKLQLLMAFILGNNVSSSTFALIKFITPIYICIFNGILDLK